MKSIKKNLCNYIDSALSLLDFPRKNYSLIPPKSSSFGDISSNVGLLVGSGLKKNPMTCAHQILDELNKNDLKNIKSITVTKPSELSIAIQKAKELNNSGVTVLIEVIAKVEEKRSRF